MNCFVYEVKYICSDPTQRGTRRDCWASMIENIKNRKNIINEKLVEASKALMTFFAVRGKHLENHKIDTYLLTSSI